MTKRMRNTLPGSLLLAAALMLMTAVTASAHCQIPCGIYDDHMRIHMIEEHVTTIEKSVNMIHSLQKESPINYNQLVRWVTNKEHHAQEIQDLVSEYFLAQRIKSDQPEYAKRLELLHQIIVDAMKCKQHADIKYATHLRSALKQFETLYFAE